MDVSNFTEKSKEAITYASNITTQNNNQEITCMHMMVSFLDDKDSMISMLLKKMDVNVDSLKIMIQEEIDKIKKTNGNIDLRFSLDMEKALDDAQKQSEIMKDEFISVEHLMLGIIDEAPEPLRKIFKESTFTSII